MLRLTILLLNGGFQAEFLDMALMGDYEHDVTHWKPSASLPLHITEPSVLCYTV
jgi:hypothetical protein